LYETEKKKGGRESYVKRRDVVQKGTVWLVRLKPGDAARHGGLADISPSAVIEA
jgi:hypothetical protein